MGKLGGVGLRGHVKASILRAGLVLALGLAAVLVAGTVILGLPVSIAYILFSAGVAGVAVLLVVAWAGRIAERSLVPLQELAGRAQRMVPAESGLGSDADSPPADELEALAQALERALTAIHDRDATLGNFGAGLEKLAAERTTELRATIAALAAAKQDADDSEVAKAEFLGALSHEFRTLVNDIMGFGQLLEPELRGGEGADSLREILRSGRQLLVLIDEFQELEAADLARIEVGRLGVRRESVALQPLVEECAGLIAPLAEGRGQRMNGKAPVCDAVALGDRSQLRQVILNMMSAAVRRNSPGGSIKCTCRTLSDSVEFSIADQGAVPTAEELEKLFELPAAGGDGSAAACVGLALSRRMARAMNGSLFAEPLGDGCVLRLQMPRARSSDPAGIESGTETGLAAGGRTVLCIEDNPANLRLFEKIFAGRKDLQFISIADPVLGLEMAQTHKPELVLLDINLPGMDGYQVLARLRALEETRVVPVIAVSAFASAADVERGLQAGFTEYHTKPIDVRRLRASIDFYLGRGS